MSGTELTQEQVQKLSAGRDLDLLIAEKVLGWRWWYIPLARVRVLYPPDEQLAWMTTPADGTEPIGAATRFLWPPKYSTDVALAFSVVEAMSSYGCGLVLEDWRNESELYPWAAYFGLPDGGTSAQGVADTAPLAICRAALLVPERLLRKGQ